MIGVSDTRLDNLITIPQAVAIVDAAPVSVRTHTVATDNPTIMGLPVSTPVLSDRDYPPFDRALVDGFALRCDDSGARKNIGAVRPGEAPRAVSDEAARGACVAIMTGAAVPGAFDAVVPIESTDAHSFDAPCVTPARDPDQPVNIARRGSEVRRGEVVVPAGTILTPTVLGVLATVGATHVEVPQRPRVGVLTTGDEVIDPSRTPTDTQIRNSNAPLLVGLLRALGAEPVPLGHVADTPDDIRAAIQTARVDVLLVTGAMSMGAHDHVPRLLVEMGYTLPITKLRMKPGKPFVFATHPNACPVFGLPGNPVSGFVCTLRLVSRLLLRMMGRDPDPLWLDLTLQSDLPENGPREFYQPARRTGADVDVLHWKGSGDVFTLMRANVLVCRPAGDRARRAGETIRGLEIPS